MRTRHQHGRLTHQPFNAFRRRRRSRLSLIETLETRALLTAAPIMDQFLVSETTSLEESAPAVAVIESNGRFVAAWTSFEQPGGDESGLGVYAQRFESDGTPIGDRILVNDVQRDGDQLAPQVAVDVNGNFIVVWQGNDEDGAGIFGQRYTTDGVVDGATFPINDVTIGDQQAPSVAMDNFGNALVTWQSLDPTTGVERVFARRYDVSGTVGDTMPVNSVMAGNQTSPTVAVARGTGTFAIAWEGEVIGDETSIEVFAQRYSNSADPIGSEIQVNTETLRDQVTPDIAMDDDGDMVVTWTSEGIPGSGSDIFAQRLDKTGSFAGSEFRVNEAVLQGQRNSVVAMDENGDFFVSWQSSHQDEFSWGIFGRAYAANGTPLTTEQQVNTFAEQPQTSPALGSNSQGQVVALWLGLDEDHASAVHGQRYQLPATGVEFAAVGEEIILANYLGLEDTSAAAAVDANRNFLVVWQSYGEDGSGLGIVGRRLDSVGNAAASAFVINTTTLGNQTNPDVAMDSAGNSVVVWESADQDGDGHGIFAQRYDVLGNPVGEEFQVNTTYAGHQRQPAVAMNADTGEFVVVWQSPDGSDDGIFGQRFFADGTQHGGEFPVNAETYLTQVSPAVAMNAAGEFAVAWVSDHNIAVDPIDSEKSIFVQWFNADGISSGNEQLVHEVLEVFVAQEYPDIAIADDGDMIVVWQSITQDGAAWGVYGRQLTADKVLIGDAEFQINQTTAENQRRATVVSDPLGNFTVSWQSDLQDQSATAIISRQYNADGTPETDEMIVNNWEIGPQILPVMAMTPVGDYGIFWDGQGLSRTEGIHGRIYEEGYVPPPPHISVAPVGSQFLVSEASGLEQSFPAVAVVEGSGNYVAAWTSFEQPENDESGLGVYAQQFQANGTPIGNAFLVNTSYTTDDQTNPAVAVNEQGHFVVVWQSLGQDEDGYGIFAQRYQPSDVIAGTVDPVGDLIEVNQFKAGDQSYPAVAMDNAGNFVITWQSENQGGDGFDIYARRYNANGIPDGTEEFPVNVTTAGNQSAATVARARIGGQFVIGWQSEILGEEGEVDVEVLATLYGPDGSPLVEEFTVNTTSDHDQVGPHVAMAANGEFVFAWTAEGQMGSGADVYARRFSASGEGLGEGEFRVNETTRQGQQYPAVGIDEVGNFLISWQSSHQDGFSWGIFGKAYDANGDVLAPEFQVNVNVQGPQTNPALNANSQGDAIVTWLGLDARHQPAVHAQRYELPTTEGSEFTVGPEGEIVLNNFVAIEEAPAAAAVDANGNYVVTWQSYGQDGSGLGVFARRFNSSGDPLSEPFLVTNTTDGNQSQPDVAVAASGDFTIVWQSADLSGSGYDIFARRFEQDGAPIGNEFRVNDRTIAGDRGKPGLAINPADGSMVIVWQGPDLDGSGIFGRRYNPAGNPVGAEFQLNAFTALDQVSPTISMNANGEFVVAWVSDHRAEFDPTDTEKSIFVQWFNRKGETVGEEVLVHSIQPEFEAQEHADVAIDPTGNFVIVWQSVNQDGNTWGVFARQFLADKTPVQPIEFQVNQTVLAPQRHPSVAADAEGNFVVAWQSHAQDSSGPGVFARVYDAAAVPQTSEFLVPTWDQGPQTSPVLAMRGSGEFGVYWTGHGTGRAEGVHGRLYGRQQPDLQVSLTDDKAKAAPGDTIVYTITYANIGNVDATGVVLTQSLPVGAAYNAAESTVGWIAGADGTYSFDVGILAAGDTPQQVVFAVTAPLVVETGVSKLSSTVSIIDDGTHGEEQTLDNNLATETTPLIKRGQGKKLDVNRDGKISSNDALIVINRISEQEHEEGEFTSQLDADVNDDGRISSLDALIVINDLNAVINLAESIEAHDRFIASLVPHADSVDQALDKIKELDDTILLLAKEKRF